MEMRATRVIVLTGCALKQLIASARAFTPLVSPGRVATLAACCSAGPLLPSEPSHRVMRPREAGLLTSRLSRLITPPVVCMAGDTTHSLPEHSQRKMPVQT